MSYSLASPNPFGRMAEYIFHFMHGSILSIGLAVSLLFAGALIAGDLPGSLRPLLGAFAGNPPASAEPAAAAAEPVASVEPVLPQALQAATDSIAKRYRVARPVVEDIAQLVEQSARASGFDPLLILAMIGVESRFNPYAESAFGAQGLMQIIGRYHGDKFDSTADGLALLDPETNIRVGVQILREYVRRTGGLDAALKLYGGESDESGMGYAEKVLAEKDRLQQAVQRARKG
jgi:soluble lytic murein transglycosylase-like protein